MKKYLLILTAFMLYGTLYAQTGPCGYEKYRDYLIEQDSSNRFLYHAKKLWLQQYKDSHPGDSFYQPIPNQSFGGGGMPGGGGCTPARYIIPVVVHIVHLPSDATPGTGTNISDAQIHHQIELLNEHFEASNIQFCLAKTNDSDTAITGIERYPHTLTTHNTPSQTGSLFALSAGFSNLNPYSHTRFLNIYVVQTILDDPGVDGGMLGYATMPGGAEQGIVIRYDWFGDSATCTGCNLNNLSRGKVLTHELGHFLGLEHTFFGGCTTPDSCHNSGDLCCDTPPCLQTDSCSSSINTCHETYHGDLHDPIHNYMGYNEHTCMNEFTPNQEELMYSVLENSRAALINPSNVNARQLSCCFLSAYFAANQTFLCTQLPGDTIVFEAYDYDGADYYWEILDSNGSTIASLNDTVPIFRYIFPNNIGKYSVRLEIAHAGEKAGLLRNAFIEIADCGSPLASTKGSWLFGEYAGIRFTDKGVIRDITPSDRSPNAIYTSEGTISISDSNGIMLFHGGGRSSDFGAFHLFGKDYLPMPNGPVIGCGSAAQGGIVVPVPGSPQRYYLFTVSARFDTKKPLTQQGLRYSVIDMTLNGGNGDVDTSYKNVIIKAVAGALPNPNDSAFMCGETINFVPKCNSPDHWLLVPGTDTSHDYFDGSNAALYVFSVTATGVSFHSKADYNIPNYYGGIKVSPNGNFVMAAGRIFRFDRTTGILTHYNLITNTSNSFFGYSFSPDSRFLYALKDDSPYPANTLYQYDLSYSDINASARAVGTVMGIPGVLMQLGPDNKIYIAQNSQHRLAVINNPNQKVSDNGTNECEFTTKGPLLASGGVGGKCTQGLPNFSDVSSTINDLDFSFVDSACKGVTFTPVSCDASPKWYFGDGDSAIGKIVKHEYSGIGSYEVKLVSGAQEVIKTVHIGVEKPIIAGDTAICDSSNQYYYSVGNPNINGHYTWSVTGGAMFSEVNPQEMRVKWDSAVHVKLLMTDMRSGCKDSTVLPVVMFDHLSRYIPDSTIQLCKGATPGLISVIDSFPTHAQVTYLWKKKVGAGSWQNISGATGFNYQPGQIDSITYFQREARIGNCDPVLTNIVTISPYTPEINSNDIYVDFAADMKTCGYTVEGNTPTIAPGKTYTYRWYESTNKTTWNPVPDPVGEIRWLNGTLNDDSIFVFRAVVSEGCSTNSDTIRMAPRVKIKRHPVDYYSCNNRVWFDMEYENPENISLSLLWFHTNDSNSTSYNVLTAQSTPVCDYTSVSNYGAYYTCQITTNDYCQVLTSFGKYVRNPNLMATFDPQPNSSETEVLETGYVAINGEITPGNGGIYNWKRSFKNVTYTSISSAPWLMVDHDLSSCFDSMWYMLEAKAGEGCPTAYSDTVFIKIKRAGELWSRDNANDTGAEPYIDATKNYWNSPDLWNCWTNSGCSVHESPEYRISDSNTVRVVIRNKGTIASAPYQVKLYWTLGGFFERWPLSWHAWPSNMLGIYYMGSEITTRDMTGLGAGSSVTISANWKAPHPSNYSTSPHYTGGSGDSVKHPLCLLSRIVTCEADPYGMTIKEEDSTGKNVINNNNIVTRNTEVYDKISQNKKSPLFAIRVGNHSSNSGKIKIGIQNLVSNYWDLGIYTLELDSNIYNAWVEGGSLGSGYTLVGNVFYISGNGFYLENVLLEGYEWGFGYFQFKLHSHVSITTDRGSQMFNFVQYSSVVFPTFYQLDGGFNFLLNFFPESYWGGGDMVVPTPQKEINSGITISDGYSQMELITIDTMDENDIQPTDTRMVVSKVTVYPNPSNSIFNLSIALSEPAEVSIAIFNGIGVQVKSFGHTEYPSGDHKEVFDAAELPPGVYYCKVTIINQTKTLRLVLNK